ncbi:MAG TPA: hypothetical protein VFR24_14840 [Candidatus Angelobacter sp.]|nr:hypothetical protein [Candidatus Angelobacter sp.]
MRSFIAEYNTGVGGKDEWLMLTRQDQRSLHKPQTLPRIKPITLIYTDQKAIKPFDCKFVSSVFIRGEICFFVRGSAQKIWGCRFADEVPAAPLAEVPPSGWRTTATFDERQLKVSSELWGLPFCG